MCSCTPADCRCREDQQPTLIDYLKAKGAPTTQELAHALAEQELFESVAEHLEEFDLHLDVDEFMKRADDGEEPPPLTRDERAPPGGQRGHRRGPAASALNHNCQCCHPRVLGGQGLRRCVVSCGTLLLWVSTYVFLSKERNLF